MTTTYLKEIWTVSRGQNTYGYNICTILDTNTNKKYRCDGGGYDMTGTSFAKWLESSHQEALTKWAQSLEKLPNDDRSTCTRSKEFYGMYIYSDHVRLDGSCGLSSMIKIAEAIGLKVKQLYTRKGSEGFIVEE
jgi:hypothetical protein